MTPRKTMRKIWPFMLLILLMSMTLAAPAFTTQPHATLSALHEEGSIKAILYAEGLPDEPITISLVDDQGTLYLLPGIRTSENIWEATFPITPESAQLTAEQGMTFIATVTIGPAPPPAARSLVTKATIKDSAGRERAARIRIGPQSMPTDMLLEIPRGRYDLSITPENMPVESIDFNDLLVEGSIDLGVEPLQNRRFVQAYAIDPTRLNFTNATVTVTAKGTTLHKCAEWNFTTQTCYGTWNVYKTGLVPGETYEFLLTPADPAFGETDGESEPDSCTFSDDAGEGDGDTNADCLAEVITLSNGYNADMDDLETAGTTATMDLAFTNILFVDTINSVNVTFRYQRQTNTQVGSTTATIQVLNGGSYVTACTDTVTIGAWEDYTCDLSSWITTEAELNDISIRLITDTTSSGQPKQTGTTFVDHVYLSADYVERDVTAPQYSDVATQPASPTTYTGTPAWFNVTWTDDFNVTSAVIEHNFTGVGLVNSSMSNSSSTYYDLRTLPAGSYVWRSYATDGINTNKTPRYAYIVSRAVPTLALTLNGSTSNITINDSGTINLQGTGGEGTLELLRETSIISSSESTVSTTETFDTVGVHNITLRHNETQNYTYNAITRTITVVDTIPPGLITSLANTSRGTSWIYWTWALPGDADFDHVEIWLNNTFKTNSTGTSYNATALSADTLYELQVRSVDTHNVKSGYATDTGRTTTSTDTTPPVISNITHADITTTSITISWDTDELTNCNVSWGTSPGTYTNSATCAQNLLHHDLALSNLNPNTDYYYLINATDLAGNSAVSAEQMFSTLDDTTAPQYSDVATQPASPTTYTGTPAWFNVTWTDDVGVTDAVIEHNFTGVGLVNSSMSSIGSTYYYTAPIDAGSYVWRSYATDGDNTNKTPQYTYTVNKATPTIALYLDGIKGDNTINEDSMITLNGTMVTPTTGYLYLYYEGGLVDQANTYVEYTNAFGIPGMYNITLAYAGSENYEGASTTYWLTVDDTTPPNVTLISPDSGHNDSDGIVVFTYNVLDDGVLANCSLLIDGTIDKTNSTVSAGSNSFTKTDFDDGLYTWNIACYDSSGNMGDDTARSLIIDKQTITIDVPVTSVGTWSDSSTILVSDINATDGSADSHTVPKNALHYITWTNYTTASIPPGATIVSADFNALHGGSTKLTFEGVKWYDGNGYIGIGCLPVPQTGTFQTDSCDLSTYVDTVDEANNISLRYEMSAGSLGNGGTVQIDYLYVTLVYIKETTAPIFTDIHNITLDIGEHLSEQFTATDNYGITSWTVNDTQFSITEAGLLTNSSPLTQGTYRISVRAYDPSDNYAEENVTITVTDLVDVNISVDTTGLGTTLEIYNSTGSLISNGGTTLTDRFLASQLYDVIFTTTLTSGPLTTVLHDVNFTQDVNFTSDITETYDGTLPPYISSVSPIYALDDQGMNFTHAELTIPKAGLDIEYIIHCTDWNSTTQTCNAWETNETADYSYEEDETHYRINVTGFDAFGGGPGDTLANITEIRIYDVTETGDNRTGGTLIDNGLNTTFTMEANRLYRAEFDITNAGKKWIIAGSDVATHTGLNDSWSVGTTSDIWYSIAGVNYTGGTFTTGTLAWDLSLGGTIDQNQNATWYYVFNTSSVPPKDYSIVFTINDTNKNSGSTDTSTYQHIETVTYLAEDISLTPLGRDSYAQALANLKEITLSTSYANGTLIASVIADATAASYSRVDLVSINETNFILGWIDGEDEDVVIAEYDEQLNLIHGPTIIESTVVYDNSDVSLAVLDDTYLVVGYVDDSENDYDIYRWNYASWTGAGSEHAIDTGIDPDETRQNYISNVGLDNGRAAHLYFDDGVSPRISVQLTDGTKNIIGQTTLLATDGGSSKVASTSLPGNLAAYTFYDDNTNSVQIAIDDFTGDQRTPVLSPTVIDSSLGFSGGVSSTAIDHGKETYYLAAWHDSNSGSIDYAVYTDDGTQIIAPTSIVTNVSSTYTLFDVTGTQPKEDVTLCPGTFMLSYVDTNDMVVTAGYWYDGTEWDGTCADLSVDETDYAVSTTTPAEGENVTINITIHSIGTANATAFDVIIQDLTTDEVIENVTIPSLEIGSNISISTWMIASTGGHEIVTIIDQDERLGELSEDNNNATIWINTTAWHVFYGDLFMHLALADETNTFYDWGTFNVTAGNLYAADADAIIDWNSLQAIGRNITNGASSEDLGEADNALGLTTFNSLTTKYGMDNSTPHTTAAFTSYGSTLNNVPVINSTTTSNFQTGVLWDTNDDSGDGEYDGSETLIFISEISGDTLGGYGTYDYEITIPSTLQQTEGATNETYFYFELS